MIRLVPMTEQEFRDYKTQAIEDYAREHVKAGHWDPSEALEKSAREFDHLLPAGVTSPGQHLFTIQEVESGGKVGIVWFAALSKSLPPFAFIYDFIIYENHRRKGYGAQALKGVEQEAKKLGLKQVGLHVFAHNQNAIDLYTRAGFKITDLNMVKEIAEDPLEK